MIFGNQRILMVFFGAQWRLMGLIDVYSNVFLVVFLPLVRRGFVVV